MKFQAKGAQERSDLLFSRAHARPACAAEFSQLLDRALGPLQFNKRASDARGHSRVVSQEADALLTACPKAQLVAKLAAAPFRADTAVVLKRRSLDIAEAEECQSSVARGRKLVKPGSFAGAVCHDSSLMINTICLVIFSIWSSSAGSISTGFSRMLCLRWILALGHAHWQKRVLPQECPCAMVAQHAQKWQSTAKRAAADDQVRGGPARCARRVPRQSLLGGPALGALRAACFRHRPEPRRRGARLRKTERPTRRRTGRSRKKPSLALCRRGGTTGVADDFGCTAAG